MIIKCPNCETSFLVPTESLAPKGRKVRCSSCKTEWFQKYNPEEDEQTSSGDVSSDDPAEASDAPENQSDDDASFKDMVDAADSEGDEGDGDIPEKDFSLEDINPEGDDVPEKEDDIPDSVKPDMEDKEETPAKGPVNKKKARIFNALYALICTFVLLGVFSMMGKVVVPLWPQSIVYYRALGFDFPLPGENLTFDRVKANITILPDGSRTLKVEGSIINLIDKSRVVPSFKIDSIRQDGSDTGVSWMVEPEESSLDGESSLNFTTEYAGELSPEATGLKFTFIRENTSE